LPAAMGFESLQFAAVARSGTILERLHATMRLAEALD